MIFAVRDPTTKLSPTDDNGQPDRFNQVVVDPGVIDKRLLVVETEFAAVLRVLGRDGNTLSPIIRGAWDSGNLRSMTKNNPTRATDAHISIVGHITRGELRRYLTNTEAGNGYMNRHLLCCARRSKLLPDGGFITSVDFQPLIKRLRDAYEFGRKAGEFRRDECAGRLWKDVYPKLSEGKPGLFGAVTSRGEAQVMRLAGLYAVLDRSQVIGVSHLRAALAAWKYCEDSGEVHLRRFAWRSDGGRYLGGASFKSSGYDPDRDSPPLQ